VTGRTSPGSLSCALRSILYAESRFAAARRHSARGASEFAWTQRKAHLWPLAEEAERNGPLKIERNDEDLEKLSLPGAPPPSTSLSEREGPRGLALGPRNTVDPASS
jgi:hypothetical protein